MWDESGSMSGSNSLKLGPEYKKLIDDYIAEQEDKMAKRTRCKFCSQVVKVVTSLGNEVLEKHIHDPHGASGGQHCVGSWQKAADAAVAWGLQEAKRKARDKVYGSELDMPRNIAEDHKAFRDIITSDAPAAKELKKKIKDGTLYHNGKVRVRPNPEPMLCQCCGKPLLDNMDCYYGDCKGKPKYKPMKLSVEILED